MTGQGALAAALTLTIGISAGASAPAQESAQGEGTVSLGMLTCRLEGDTNLVVFSRESFGCNYETTGGETARYDGVITKVGADLQLKSDQTMKWAVLAPSARSGADILGGVYLGASAEATAGVGVGARALVGGSGSQIILQPISASGQTGGGASITLDGLRLTPVQG